MFQPNANNSFSGGHGGGLLFAPRPPIQRGEGLFSALSSIFRKVTPFLKKGLSTGSKVLKKVAASDVVQDIKKGVGNAAVDITSNLVADLVAGKHHEEATDAANERLQKARIDIANMMRNPSLANTKALPRHKSKRKNRKRKNDSDDDDEDNENEGDDENSEGTFVSTSSSSSSIPKTLERKESMKNQTKKMKLTKKKQARKGRKGKRKTAYSVFDDESE